VTHRRVSPAKLTFMVSKGQFSERPTLIPSGPVVLEGLWHRGDRKPPLLLSPPLPAEGGGMDHVVAAEVAWAAAMAGHPSIRFNFRGVGASQGRTEGLSSCAEDLKAAADLLAENTGCAQVAQLFIGGAGKVALERLHRAMGICLVSPVELDLERLARLELPLLVICGEADRRSPRGALARAVFTAGGRLEEVSSADAAFLRNLSEVGRTVVAWLKTLEAEEGRGA